MATPSMSVWGSTSMMSRSLKVPGSLSSALTTRYFGPGPFGTNDHLRPVGKPAPPRPLRPESFTIAVTSSGVFCRAFFRPTYPPRFWYSSRVTAVVRPGFGRRIGW
jgi:hypothetical protein